MAIFYSKMLSNNFYNCYDYKMNILHLFFVKIMFFFRISFDYSFKPIYLLAFKYMDFGIKI